MSSRDWIHYSEEHSDPLIKFALLWVAFNGQYSLTDGRVEKDRIKNYLSNNVDDLISTEILENCQLEVDYLKSIPVTDMPFGKKTTSEHIQSFNQSQGACERLSELFMIIYHVRCNLLHGQKSLRNERDQRLCRDSAKILRMLLENCTLT